MIAAARLPARRLPANSQFDRPRAIGLIWFSTQLFEIGTSPSLTKCVSSLQRFRLSVHTGELRLHSVPGGLEEILTPRLQRPSELAKALARNTEAADAAVGSPAPQRRRGEQLAVH